MKIAQRLVAVLYQSAIKYASPYEIPSKNDIIVRTTGIRYEPNANKRINNSGIPYKSNELSYRSNRAGKNVKRILKPSSGGIGKRLKIPSRILTIIILSTISTIGDGAR
jgi:hypothetical protein